MTPQSPDSPVTESQSIAELGYVSPEVQRQELSHRRRLLWITTVTLLAGAASGVIMNYVDDASSRLTSDMEHIVWLVTAGAVLAILSIGTAVLTRARWTTACLAVVLVIGAFFAAMFIFDKSPLKNTIGYIRGNETPREQFAHAMGMRLYLCWAPTVMIAATSLLIARPRPWLRVGVIFGVGLISALLWGVQQYPYSYEWGVRGKWVKFTSSGLLFLVLLLLCQLLATAIGSLRRTSEKLD